MPKCKECGETITKFDKEICPYCGCKDPIDKDREETCDITQAISTFSSPKDENVKVKEHKKEDMIIFDMQFLFPLIIGLSALLLENIVFSLIVGIKRKKDASGVFIR